MLVIRTDRYEASESRSATGVASAPTAVVDVSANAVVVSLAGADSIELTYAEAAAVSAALAAAVDGSIAPALETEVATFDPAEPPGEPVAAVDREALTQIAPAKPAAAPRA